jgi:repressor LexA
MKDLTDKQESILLFLQRFLEEHDYPPSIRDIQLNCNISSTSVVDYNLRKLEEKGYIRRDREVSRGIELVGARRRPRVAAVPLLGQIAAGQPIPVPAADTWNSSVYDDVLEVPEELLGGRHDVYALRVKGTSMIDALINDGDIVFMEPAQAARNGDMVAVWLKDRGEVTFKKYFHEGSRVRLQPENSSMEPIYTTPDNVEIQGKFVASFRGALA